MLPLCPIQKTLKSCATFPFDSAKGEVFVGIGTNVVSVINDTTNTVVKTIPAGDTPQALAYDPVKGEIFGTAGFSSVLVISDATNTLIKTITVGSFPRGIAYDSFHGEIYVANSASKSVSVLSD